MNQKIYNIKISEKFKKNYMYISITVLSLCIYIILFPFFSSLLGHILPDILACPYKELTGNPCPLCGGTRYIANLSNVFIDITYLFNPFGIIICAVIFEMFFRIFLIIKIKTNKVITKKNIIFDIFFHIIVAIIFIIYVATFIIRQY